MLITKIVLENWKSYEFAAIDFAAGTTAILGENGSGKSSLLEAIGLCLFDHRTAKFAGLLREGAKEAAVLVRICLQNGAEYLIERMFNAKGTTSYRVHATTPTQDILAEGAAEVLRWVRQGLGLAPETDLGSLFKNTIGVPQGTFTAPFLLAATQRKAVFDPLLRVQDWRKASDNLLPTASTLKEREGVMAQAIARMEGELAYLSELREERERLVHDTQQLEVASAILRTETEILDEKLICLDAAEKLVAQTDRQACDMRREQEHNRIFLENAQELLLKSVGAAQLMEQHKFGHDFYLATERELGEVEIDRKERDELLARRVTLQGQLIRLENAREQYERLKQEGADGTALLLQIKDGLQEEKRISLRMEELEANVQVASTEVHKVRATGATAEAEIMRLKEEQRTLVGSALGRCPLCHSTLTPEHREQVLARNGAEIHKNVLVLETVGQQERETTATLSKLQTQMARCRSELRGLPRATDLTKAEANHERSLASRATARRLLEGLSHIPQQIERIDAELLSFAELDDRLAVLQKTRTANKVAYLAYVSSTELAEQSAERQAKVDELEAERERLRGEYERLIVAYLEACRAYKADEHATSKTQLAEKRQRFAATQAQLQEKCERLALVRGTIERLEVTARELGLAAAAAIETHELLTMTETVRQILREAGPYVTQRLVRQISQGASAIYGDLMGDPTHRLDWSDDYELTLDVRGQSRSFSQLSGGEQMSAALALRLGLLHETSSIDLVLFDEPTAHLDPERRESLAERIMEVKGFSQMFVISHDDTFQTTANRFIRILKDETGSHPQID